MWMMMNSNNNHGGDQLKPPPDLVIGRKLRPLMPRPVSSCSSPYSTLSNPSCCCTQNPKILSWNHPMSDHGVRREIHTAAAPLVSTRWNPTPEQLQALEEMYRRGIRTPSAEQIQQIAAKLGRFGKIEGKNVFYWFQNHKARERQKKRRQLELLAGKKNHHAYTSDKTQTGLSRRFIETEHHKNVPVPSNCSTTPSEDSASMHGAVITAECGKDGWAQLNHKELQHKIATAENETCWQLDLSSCLPPSPNSINAITAHRATGQENTYPYDAPNLITVLPPKNEQNHNHNHNQAKENQTLQLFPKSPTTSVGGEEISHIGTKIRPSDFIEFLPIKN